MFILYLYECNDLNFFEIILQQKFILKVNTLLDIKWNNVHFETESLSHTDTSDLTLP